MIIGTGIVYVAEIRPGRFIEFTWTGKAHMTDGAADAFLMEDSDGVQVVVPLNDFVGCFQEKGAYLASKCN